MTAEQLAADRAVINAATPGPWSKTENWYDGPWHGVLDASGQLCLGIAFTERDSEREEKIADFIAAARTRWPAALDEVERLRADAGHVCPCRCAEVEQLRKENAALRQEIAEVATAPG